MIKIIYAEQRVPSFSREAFVRRWRVHAGFAMAIADFWDPMHHYIQNDSVADARAFAHNTPAYDGVGELYYPDLAACQASLASTRIGPIVADGDVLFSRNQSIFIIADQDDLRDERPGLFKTFLFLRTDDGKEAALALDLANRARQVLAAGGPLGRHARQAAVAHAVEPAKTQNVAIEFSFDTLADAAAGHADWMAALETGSRPLPLAALQPVGIVCHSCLLYDKRFCT